MKTDILILEKHRLGGYLDASKLQCQSFKQFVRTAYTKLRSGRLLPLLSEDAEKLAIYECVSIVAKDHGRSVKALQKEFGVSISEYMKWCNRDRVCLEDFDEIVVECIEKINTRVEGMAIWSWGAYEWFLEHRGAICEKYVVHVAGYKKIPTLIHDLMRVSGGFEVVQSDKDVCEASVTTCETFDEEMQYVLAWIKENIAKGKQSVVAIPGLRDVEAEVNRALHEHLFSKHIWPTGSCDNAPVDIGITKSISESGIGACLEQVVSVCDDSLSKEFWNSFLLNPFLAGFKDNVGKRRLISLAIKGDERKYIPCDEILKHARSHQDVEIMSVIELVIGVTSKRMGAAQWSSVYQNLLLSCLSQGAADLKNASAYKQMHSLVKAFIQLAPITKSAKSGRYWMSILKRMLRETVLPITEKDALVKIVDGHDLGNLIPDNSWFMCMDFGAWKRSPLKPSLISPGALAEMGHPCTNEKQERELQTVYLNRVLKYSTASSCCSVFKGRTMTPWAVGISEFQDMTKNHYSSSVACTFSQMEDQGSPLISDSDTLYRGREWINEYNYCSMRAYLKFRIGMKQKQHSYLGLSPRQISILKHKTMELFWLEQKTIPAKSIDLESAVRCRYKEGLEALTADKVLFISKAISEHVENIVVTSCMRSIENDVSRDVEFEVVGTETPVSIKLQGLTINGVVDRIDRVGDALICRDYKGSRFESWYWTGGDIKELQMPLYLMNEEVDFQGIAIEKMRINDDSLVGIGEDVGVPYLKNRWAKSNFDEFKENSEALITNIVSGIKEGHCNKAPLESSACNTCEFKFACVKHKLEFSESGYSESHIQ